MNYIGVSAGFHDAALSIVNSSGDILFASHSERYSKIKHDSTLSEKLIADANTYASDKNQIHYYERPLLKSLRQVLAGQKLTSLTARHIVGESLLTTFNTRQINVHSHHLSHAAAGFQTSDFNDSTVVVIDAIGEFDTITIWHACYDQHGFARYQKLWSRKYPNSIGLFYSALTQHVGLKPLDEEYIMMGMAAYGIDVYNQELESLFDISTLDFKRNLHLGLDDLFLEQAEIMDIAASAQSVTEKLIDKVMEIAKTVGKSNNLVYSGGVALNCLANRLLGKHFENIWIMPNPGDAGSSLGAAALGYGKKLNWVNAYLGYDINREYPVKDIVEHLKTHKIVGVANGKAEFGPRALGNRSLLADPQGYEIKDQVNQIKRRQKFRPFAPVILEEHVDNYFVMPTNWKTSRYMQTIAKCKYPNLFPAICHHDNTSRVQTVPKDNTGIRQLLEHWYDTTGCPMLLNTSLNIRGEPMVNDIQDAKRFTDMYGVKVL